MSEPEQPKQESPHKKSSSVSQAIDYDVMLLLHRTRKFPVGIRGQVIALPDPNRAGEGHLLPAQTQIAP